MKQPQPEIVNVCEVLALVRCTPKLLALLDDTEVQDMAHHYDKREREASPSLQK